MAGNRNKAQATQRLIELGIAPGYIEEEEAAAFYRMSVGTFRQWQKNQPAAAPKPHWLNGCKRYKVSELTGSSSAAGANPWDEPAAP